MNSYSSEKHYKVLILMMCDCIFSTLTLLFESNKCCSLSVMVYGSMQSKCKESLGLRDTTVHLCLHISFCYLFVCISIYKSGMPIFRFFFPFFPLFLARSVLRQSVSRFPLFSIFSYFIFLFLNFLSLFVFIFCETARTRRFSVIFTKVQWHP